MHVRMYAHTAMPLGQKLRCCDSERRPRRGYVPRGATLSTMEREIFVLNRPLPPPPPSCPATAPAVAATAEAEAPFVADNVCARFPALTEPKRTQTIT